MVKDFTVFDFPEFFDIQVPIDNKRGPEFSLSAPLFAITIVVSIIATSGIALCVGYGVGFFSGIHHFKNRSRSSNNSESQNRNLSQGPLYEEVDQKIPKAEIELACNVAYDTAKSDAKK